MGHSKKTKRKRKLIHLYTKPFTKRVPALVATNDKRYIPSGTSSGAQECSHEYCLAERTRDFMDSDDMIKPVGLPWASGKLKYLPGHVKITFPMRKNKTKSFQEKTKKSVNRSALQISYVDDKITNPEMCGTIDEIIYAYKVFMLAGMIISEARDLIEAPEVKEDSDDDELS